MRLHWPTPAISCPPLIAGPAAPTAELPGGVHGPGPRPLARLGLAVASGRARARAATAPSVFRRFILLIACSISFRLTADQSRPPPVVPVASVAIARPKAAPRRGENDGK